MRNINELIGIIKGINFDGVINDKEVVRLQSWVDKNRNLAYEPRQVELIKLLNTVLEDHIIDDNERELILDYSEKYINDMGDDAVRIYQLNGIIEGIVCDGVVNEAEVYRLKDWMDAYGDYIREQNPNADISKIVDVILEDGIVTEKEQCQLLKMLSARISKSQFETKLRYLCKQVKARKNIGIDLIDILDNQDAMDEIHQRAEEQLFLTLNSYTGAFTRDPEVVFVSLSLIGMLEYDGSYYDSVRRTYTDLYRRFSAQSVEGLIRTILNRYRTEEERDSNNKSRIINVVLSNAIVPSHFMAAYFEFIYDIYKLNFEYDLADDLYEEFRFVYEGLRSSMMSEGDDIQDNVTKKTYKLIKTTKQLIAGGKYLDSVIKLSIIIVKLIDKQIWKKGVQIYNPYLKIGFDKWVSTLKDDAVHGGQRSVSEWRSRWEPKYMLDGNVVYLVPPVHKVKAEYNFWDIFVQVLNNGKVIYEDKDLDIRKIIAGYKVSGERIKLDAPLNKLSYRLVAGSRVIYDSRDKLHRKFLVFDKDGLEIQNNTDYKGTAVFCYKNDKEKLSPYFTAKGYKLASRNIKYGDSYYIDDVVFNFSALIKPGIFGDAYDNVYLLEEDSSDKIKVFKEIKFLVFESENRSRTFEILINDKAFKLSDFPCTTTERDGVYKYVIDLTIYEVGIYNIVVNQMLDGKRKRITAFNFALDPGYEAGFDKLDDTTFAFMVKSSLSDITISGQIKLIDFDENFVTIEHKGKVYHYIIPIDLGAYRISESEWKPLSEEIWIGDVSQDSILDVYDAEVDELMIYSSRGQMLETIQMIDKGVYRQAHIGFLVSYKEEYEYTLLVLLKEGKTKRTVFCNNQCIMRDETELIFDTLTRTLRINPWFYGKGNVYCEISDSNEESVYKSDILKNDCFIEVPDLKSYEKYSITFFEKGKGLTLKKNREMKRYNRVFYAREDFVDKEFRIAEIYYNVGDSGVQRYMLTRSYLHLLNKGSDGSFSGEIYIRDVNPRLRSNLVKPVEVVISSEVINGNIELVITKMGKHLTLDTSRNHVSDSPMNNGSEVESYTVEIN